MAVYSACVSAQTSSAAGEPEPDLTYRCYSAQGNYLRPAVTDRGFVIRVGRLRETRSFRTEEVRVYQLQQPPAPAPPPSSSSSSESPAKKPGMQLNLCMTAVVDFIKAAPDGQDRSILFFDEQPSFSPVPKQSATSALYPLALTHHSKLPKVDDSLDAALAAAASSDKTKAVRPSAGELKALKTVFAPHYDTFDTKSPPESLWDQCLWGIMKDTPTSQDDWPVDQKRGYDWIKAKAENESSVSASQAGEEQQKDEEGPLIQPNQYSHNLALVAWVMDAAISFTPLSFSHRFLDDAGPTASLDFSLRLHDDNLDLTKDWHLREIRTRDSRWERNYGEGRLWREVDGKTLKSVATMTQACVMKSKPPPSVAKKANL